MESLGLEKDLAAVKRDGATGSGAKRRRVSAEGSTFVRKSSRLSGAAVTHAEPTGAGDRIASSVDGKAKSTQTGSREHELFKECESRERQSKLVWDTRRMHQHLTRSPTGCAVATTGVAGYGAALCALAGREPAPPTWQAEVEAVRFGVGGFSIAVVRRDMPPPFKSLGKTAFAVNRVILVSCRPAHAASWRSSLSLLCHADLFLLALASCIFASVLMNACLCACLHYIGRNLSVWGRFPDACGARACYGPGVQPGRPPLGAALLAK